MTAYYNEKDPYAAQWLRNLISAGHIADGVVDERSIEEVTPDDVRGFAQCHWFAGIGVWSYALRRAGWPDDRPVWTGSCPCQPFSSAGKGKGTEDERHLWPEMFRLARECRPGVIFGEQVASKDGLGWLDLVHADLEGADYAFAAVDLCAAGIGAPHIRQRLYWVADSDNEGLEGRSGSAGGADQCAARARGLAGGMADSGDERRQRERLLLLPGQPRLLGIEARGRGEVGGMAHADVVARGQGGPLAGGRDSRGDAQPRTGLGGGRCLDGPAPTDGFWGDADWIYCRDDKWRPVESGTFPLADGSAGRVGRLRAYGNAIVAPVAAGFVAAYLAVRR